MIVFFEGQAYGEGSEYFLAPGDFQLSKPAETGIPLKWLVETLEKCPSSDKLLIVDTFHVGSTERYPPQTSPVAMLRSQASSMKSLQAIGARDDSQLGQLWPEKSHGSFAWELAAGFKGAADTNRDLHIDASEIFTSLREKLGELSFDKSRPQTPQLFP